MFKKTAILTITLATLLSTTVLAASVEDKTPTATTPAAPATSAVVKDTSPSVKNTAPIAGDTAPDFTATASDGSTVTLSSLKGKVVVIDWANYGCPFDHMHYASGNLPGLEKTYTTKGVVWLSIMSSGPGKEGYFTQSQLKDENTKNNNHASYVLMDNSGAIGKLYGAKTTPHVFVIDTQGIVQYSGAIDSIPSTDQDSLAKATPYLANAIDAVMTGKSPNPATTKPYGCNVKYAD